MRRRFEYCDVKMKKLSWDQRRALAEFCANFAVAWLAAGVIGPLVAGWNLSAMLRPATMSTLWAGVLLIIMLYLTRRSKK